MLVASRRLRILSVVTIAKVFRYVKVFPASKTSVKPCPHWRLYSRRFRRLSPKTATVAEFDDSLQCGQAIRVRVVKHAVPAAVL